MSSFFHHSHVHGFLKELGQGIQHIASRVDNLVAFVQRANDSRKITGEVSDMPCQAQCVCLLLPQTDTDHCGQNRALRS